MSEPPQGGVQQIKIPEAAGPRGAKDSGYFREAIAIFEVATTPTVFGFTRSAFEAGGRYDAFKNGSTRI